MSALWPASSARLAIVVGFTTMLSGCFGFPNVNSADSPATSAQVTPERAAAVADMRVEAAAGDKMRYPKVFQVERTIQLAKRPEPLPVSQVDTIKAELEAISATRVGTQDSAALAALDAREEELRRLLEEVQAKEAQ